MRMRERIENFRRKRIFALLQKEIRQIFRDKQLISFLLIPPIVQILAYGYALSPQVEHLRLAVLDQSMTPLSRELTSALALNRVFDLEPSGGSERSIANEVRVGKLDAAVIIPPDFQRRLASGRQSPIQVIIDAVDANTAGIANGYIAQMIIAFNSRLRPDATAKGPLLAPSTLPPSQQPQTPSNQAQPNNVQPAAPAQTAVAQNPLNVLSTPLSNRPLPPDANVVPLFQNTAPPAQIANASTSLLNGVVAGNEATGANAVLATRAGNLNGFNNIMFVAADQVNPSAHSFTQPMRGSAVDASSTANLTTQRPIAETISGPNAAVYPNATTGSNLSNLILNGVTNTEFSSRPPTAGAKIITSSTALPGALSSLGTAAQNGLAALEMFNSTQLEVSESLFPLTSINPTQAAGQQPPDLSQLSITDPLVANLTLPPIPIIPVSPTASSTGNTNQPASGSQNQPGGGAPATTPNQQSSQQNQNLTPSNSAANMPAAASPNASMTTMRGHAPIEPQISYLYNKGLTASWFFVPGVIGLVVTITGTLVSTIALVREKDSGTLEQLLMTPVGSLEILVSKIVPLFVLLIGDFFFALALGQLLFNVPLRGSLLLLVFITSVYLFVALSIGITLATICRNQRQAILTSFFFNLPLIQLSGAVAPVESMPDFWQHLALLDPLRFYIICLRSILLKGVGLEVLWGYVLVLFVFATVFMSWSVYQFRRQLS